MEENSVLIGWVTKQEERCLKFTFNGRLTEVAALHSIANWRTEFSGNVEPDQKINLIWDCTKMKGYDTNARKLWQSIMAEQANKIADIYIITTDNLLRTVAKTMGLLTRFSIKTVSTEKEIQFSSKVNK